MKNRRTFLKTMGAAATFTIVPAHILRSQTAPSNQLTKAVIGVGHIGMAHLGTEFGTSKLLAVCDVDESHLKNALQRGGPDVKGYHDFREVLARPDIDIVHIPTPPHWHALISIAAAEAGKDIWCEKPMARTIGESRKVRDAVIKHGRMFRINTRCRYESELYGMKVPTKQIKKAIMNGLLGWPLKVTVGESQGFHWKLGDWQGNPDLKLAPVPAGLDYNFWLGPAPYKPYSRGRSHEAFRGYWDYDGGGLGDMGMHYLDPVQYLLDKDETSPVEIEADTQVQHPEVVRPWRRIRMKYADGCEIILDGDNTLKDAPYIEGPKGKIFNGFKSDIVDLDRKLRSLPEPPPQQTDFLDSVRTRKKFTLNESNGHRSCNLVNLSICALRTGRLLHYDPVAEKFINDEGANRLIDQPMRAPWRV